MGLPVPYRGPAPSLSQRRRTISSALLSASSHR
jgi:hypothetical protein